MVGDKLRFRFEKTGDVRLLSHHDLMRCAERMMRRAEIPFKLTAGFHPTPRLVFALSLSLGIIGRHEVVELELTEPRDAQSILNAIRSVAPEGWYFLYVSVIPMKCSAVPRRIEYALAIPHDRIECVREQLAATLSQNEVWVDRLHPRPRQVDIRPYIRGLAIVDDRLVMDLWVTPTGTARADELLKLLKINDLVESYSILERIELELADETPSDAPDAPPTGPAITRRLELPSGVYPDDEDSSPSATWGLSPSGPIVE